MGKFSKLNKRKIFNIDTTDFEYKSLKDLYLETNMDEDLIHPIRGLYINTRNKFGDAPILATEDCYINLPEHLLLEVKSIIDDEELVSSINNGEAGFKIRKYKPRNYDKECFTIEWADL